MSSSFFSLLHSLLALPSNPISFLGAGKRSQGGSVDRMWKAVAMLCCPLVAIILLALLFHGYGMQGLVGGQICRNPA